MIKKILYSLLALVFVVQIVVAVKVNYPPSFEQVGIGLNIWILRALCLTWVTMGSVLVASLLGDMGLYFLLFLFGSPYFWGLWVTRSIESIKYGLIMLVVYWAVRWRRSNNWLVALLVILVLFNGFQYKDKANIYSFTSLGNLAQQTEEKFLREDDLLQRMALPLWFRRAAYNKFSMFGRDMAKELITYWNLEKVFYQEMSPGSEKGLIMFVWPLVIPFFVGIYSFRIQKNKQFVKIIFWLFLISYFNYIFSSARENYRWLIVFPLVSVVISMGMMTFSKNRFYLILVGFLWVYGWQLSLVDLKSRPDYWLDNRPLVYRNLYLELARTNNFSKIFVTDRLGNSKEYCKVYLGTRCESENIAFGIETDDFQKGVYYAGFIGEFLGRDLNNKFGDNSSALIVSKGFEKLTNFKIRDSVAFGYGDELFVGIKQ